MNYTIEKNWEMECGQMHDYNEDMYALLCKTNKEAKTVNKLINTVLKNAVKRIHEIGKKYPNAGIGDTETDECIVDTFYSLMHYRLDI